MEAENDMEDEVQRSGGDEHFAEEQNEKRQMVGAFFEPELGEQVGVACAVDEHGAKNRGHDDERNDCGEQRGVGQVQLVSQIRLQVHGRTDGDGEQQRAENQHTNDINRKQVLPVLVFAVVVVVIGITVEKIDRAVGQYVEQLVIGWLGRHDAKRRGEGCDNRNSNDNRIEEVAGYAKAHA